MATPTLLPIELPADQTVVHRPRFEVQVGRVRVRAELGADVEYITALVAALRARC